MKASPPFDVISILHDITMVFFLRPFTYDILAICSGLAVGTVPNKRYTERYYNMKIEFSTTIIRHRRKLLRPTIKRTRCPTKEKKISKNTT